MTPTPYSNISNSNHPGSNEDVEIMSFKEPYYDDYDEDDEDYDYGIYVEEQS